MSMRAPWLALILSLLLAGCAGPYSMQMHPDRAYAMKPRVEKKLDCNGAAECKVVVTVSCWGTPVVCATSLDNDVVVVHSQRDIKWTLVAPKDYAFADNGIDVHSDATADPHDFDCGRSRDGGFFCHDKFSRPAVFKYTVNVSGPVPPPPYDPWIVNNN
jgi:hypothetical protein